MHDIRTITLDLDDTLWAIQPVIERAEQQLYDWLGDNVPRVVEMFGTAEILTLREQVIAENVEKAYDLTFLRRTVLSRMGVSAGCGDGFVDDAFAVFDEARQTLELFPEARAALESLHGRYTLIAVTNGNASLEKIGIDDLFDDFVSAATAGVAKPHRAIFDAAVRVGGAEPHETLHVGDHPEYDVGGARAAGLKTVWVNRNGHEWPSELPQPDETVADLGELDRIMPQYPGGQ
ncbi:MAG: HAD family hydrolase [Woeseiaceae bacterium]